MLDEVYDIPLVLDRREALVKATKQFVGKELSGKTYHRFVTCVAKGLPADIPRALVDESLRHLAAETVSASMLHDNLWRLAGNLPKLTAYHAVPPWANQTEDEYVPMQIVAAEGGYNHRRRNGAHFTFQILAGSCCPMRLEKFWTSSFCSVLASRLGFTKLRYQYPFLYDFQLVDMRFYALIEADRSRGTPFFDQIWEVNDAVHPPACRTWNRQIMRMRSTVYRQCPKNYGPEIACHTCHVGQDECLSAVHAKTYVARRCPECKQEEWFDPAKPDRQWCVNCSVTRQLKR